MTTDKAVDTVYEHPEYRRLEGRIAALELQRAAAEAELGQLEASAAEEVRHQSSPRSHRAAALLAGDGTNSPSPQALADARVRAADLAAAVALGRRELDALQARLSATIAPTHRREHAAAVARIVEAVITLGRAIAIEQAFRDGLDAGGVRYSAFIRPMAVPLVGTLDDPNSVLRMYLEEAREHGFKVPAVPEIERANVLAMQARNAEERRRAERRRLDLGAAALGREQAAAAAREAGDWTPAA